MATLNSIAQGVTNAITAAPSTATATGTSSTAGASSTTGVDKTTLAGNFQTFLTLLTTQLKNQNPLDPLDTNQFTQQLVQFAQVEQQLKQNDQLATLISIEKSAQATTALAFVGATVAVDGQSAALANGQATWSFSAPKPVSATITIRSATGQTVYSGSYTMNAGAQNFVWDGRDNKGAQWPAGTYTMSVTAKDASGQAVAIPTEVQGVVDSVDLMQTPPVLSIGQQTFTLDKIKRVVRH
jgi:flagellar basal-body rod modification protein FlgD